MSEREYNVRLKIANAGLAIIEVSAPCGQATLYTSKGTLAPGTKWEHPRTSIRLNFPPMGAPGDTLKEHVLFVADINKMSLGLHSLWLECSSFPPPMFKNRLTSWLKTDFLYLMNRKSQSGLPTRSTIRRKNR